MRQYEYFWQLRPQVFILANNDQVSLYNSSLEELTYIVRFLRCGGGEGKGAALVGLSAAFLHLIPLIQSKADFSALLLFLKLRIEDRGRGGGGCKIDGKGCWIEDRGLGGGGVENREQELQQRG